jgi:hypothetical protein
LTANQFFLFTNYIYYFIILIDIITTKQVCATRQKQLQIMTEASQLFEGFMDKKYSNPPIAKPTKAMQNFNFSVNESISNFLRFLRNDLNDYLINFL